MARGGRVSGPPRGTRAASPVVLRACTEVHLSATTRRQLTDLRSRCFPASAVPRPYLKQLPHWRLLARQGGVLVAQAGVDHRMVAFDGQPASVLGVVDLCVDPAARGQGLAGRMLEYLHRRACDGGVDALLLAADDPRLYLRHGFVALDLRATWLRVHEHRTLGLACESLHGVLMLRPAARALHPLRTVDLLGTLF